MAYGSSKWPRLAYSVPNWAALSSHFTEKGGWHWDVVDVSRTKLETDIASAVHLWVR